MTPFFARRYLPLALWVVPGTAMAQSLADEYPNDEGLADDPAVLYFRDFDDETQTRSWAGGKAGYGWTGDAEHVFSGSGALEIQHTAGTHNPSEIHPEIPETDVAYVRWYRKWEAGYDFTQHKMPGVYAWADGQSGGGAGEVPDGTDKFSSKLFVDFDRYPRFYSYHPDQPGIYGDSPHMNLVDPKIQVEADRWYCFEMMIKANSAPDHDGELKMWIDGQLVGHYENMRFRDVNTLKINQFTYSAYVGGTWTSERDQKLWDDQIVVATRYIGPLTKPPPDAGAMDGSRPPSLDSGVTDSDASSGGGEADSGVGTGGTMSGNTGGSSGAGTGGTGTTGTGGATGGAGTAGADSTGGALSESPGAVDGGSGRARGQDDAGCGCRTTRAAPPPWLGVGSLLALALFAARRAQRK